VNPPMAYIMGGLPILSRPVIAWNIVPMMINF
jgi:hypothetical protein